MDDETLYCLTYLCFFSLHSSLFTHLSSLFSLCSLSVSFFFPSLSLCSRQSHTSSTLCLFFGLQISFFFLVLHPHSSFSSSSVLHPSPLLHLTISLDQKRTKPVHSLSHTFDNAEIKASSLSARVLCTCTYLQVHPPHRIIIPQSTLCRQTNVVQLWTHPRPCLLSSEHSHHFRTGR